MRRLMVSLLVVVTLLGTAVLPAVAQSEPVSETAGVGITLFILALVLGVIFAVAVIAAVGLGVIGIGYNSVNESE